jgi:2-oxoglutarate ferredoxin oxidoreductase subunit beta
MDMTVICVNNFIYGMTGGQLAPTTPTAARTSTSPLGNRDHPFNLAYLAAASGAAYVARWTTLHVRRLERALTEALLKPGFSFVEIISPCPTLYGRLNKQKTGLEQMQYYKASSIIRHGADPRQADIALNGQIVVGKFVDLDKPSYLELQKG